VGSAWLAETLARHDSARLDRHRATKGSHVGFAATKIWFHVGTGRSRRRSELAATAGDRHSPLPPVIEIELPLPPVMEPHRRQPNASPPSYDVNDDYFSVEIHYKGFFCGLGKKRIYMDNKIDWFDFCNTDTWSLLYVDDFLGILECNNSASTRVYWCEPGKSVGDGLRSLRGDADIIAMSNVASTCKNIMLYVDHLNFLDGIFHNGTQQL